MTKAKKEELSILLNDLFRLSDNLIREYSKRKPTTNTPQSLMMFFISKSRQSAKAFNLLIDKGLKHDATSILRTIFENIINMEFIFNQENPELWSERYIEYNAVLSHKYAEKLLKHGHWENEQERETLTERKKELENKILQLENKYGKSFSKSSSWSGTKIKEMAYKLDKNIQYHYDISYSLWSDFAHANILSSKSYTEEVEGKIDVIEKKDFNCEAEISSLIHFFIIMNERLNNECKLGMESQLEALKNKYIIVHKV